MTTIAIIFGAVIVIQAAVIVLVCWSADRKTRNEFQRPLGGTVRRIHP